MIIGTSLSIRPNSDPASDPSERENEDVGVYFQIILIEFYLMVLPTQGESPEKKNRTVFFQLEETREVASEFNRVIKGPSGWPACVCFRCLG